MKTNIIVVFSSHFSDKENDEFIKHVDSTIGKVDHTIKVYPNFNEYSLTEVYNKAIIDFKDELENSIMVFCHNDIIFETKKWGNVLLKHFNDPTNDYQIIGVAGTDSIQKHGIWWLNDEKEMDLESMYGIVNHLKGFRKEVSEYSPEFKGVKPVVTIDGLFMAVDISNIENYFDETFEGFHMYDVSFCVSNYLDGCNIGVISDLRLTHKSVGQTNEQWEENRKQFVEKYKNYLPLTLEE